VLSRKSTKEGDLIDFLDQVIGMLNRHLVPTKYSILSHF